MVHGEIGAGETHPKPVPLYNQRENRSAGGTLTAQLPLEVVSVGTKDAQKHLSSSAGLRGPGQCGWSQTTARRKGVHTRAEWPCPGASEWMERLHGRSRAQGLSLLAEGHNSTAITLAPDPEAHV